MGPAPYRGENEGICLAAPGGSRTDMVPGVDWGRQTETYALRDDKDSLKVLRET
jgi:hypothetical protein